MTTAGGAYDLSLKPYADHLGGGPDPYVERERVATADPQPVRGMATAFRGAGARFETAWSASMRAQQTIGAAATSGGAPIRDEGVHLAALPAGFDQASALLTGAAAPVEAVADDLVLTKSEIETAIGTLTEEIQRIDGAWRARVAEINAAGGITEQNLAGVLAERDGYDQQVATAVRTAQAAVTGRITAYEGVVHDALRVLADQGFVPPEELTVVAPPAPAPEPGYAGTEADPRAVLGTPIHAGYAADPVNTAIGNFVETETDVAFEGVLAGLTVARTYNSRAVDEPGPFGPRWASWASARLVERDSCAEYVGPDGQGVSVPKRGAAFARVPDLRGEVVRGPDGLVLAWFDGRRWEFDAAGRPLRTSAGPGTGVTFRHDELGRLVALGHERGRSVTLRWGGDRVVAVEGGGPQVRYRYDDSGRLVAADVSAVDTPAGERRYELDEAGLVAAVTDADGVAELRNTYDERGRVVSQLTPFGRHVRFSYASGTTVVADEADGPRNVYEHDSAGRLVAGTDGHGHVFRRRYSAWGDLTEAVARGGAVTRSRYDDRSRLVHRVAPSGAETALGYDAADRVVAVTVRADGVECVSRLAYHGAERVPAEIVDAEGGVTRLSVADGLVHAVTDPDGVTVRFTYDADGALVAATDAAGGVARIERDAAGRVVATVTPAGRRTELERDGRGRVVVRRDPSGAQWRTEYSPAGRVVATVDPTGVRTETAHGPHGEPVSVTDPLGATSHRSYDVMGSLSALVGPGAAKWSWAYDALCRVSAITDPGGGTWLREHDADGRLVAETDPEGGRTTARYDAAGRLVATGDGLAETAYTVDASGRPVARVLPDGGVVQTEYDRLGRRVREIAPDGAATSWEWSPAGRLRSVTSPSGRVERFTYDDRGRRVARVDGSGRRFVERHDADGLLVERVSPGGLVESVERDAVGRPVRHRVPGRAAQSWTYDGAGRIVAHTSRAGRVQIERDAVGRAVAVADGLGHVTRYGWDTQGLLVSVTDPLGGRVGYARDAAGRVESVTDPLGRVTRFGYDGAGRLRERTDGDGHVRRWAYDAAGRVVAESAGDLRRTYERDALGRPVRVAETGPDAALPVTLRWDAAGRLVERVVGERAVGWTYDADGLRTALVHPDGSRTGYVRDGAGRVVAIERADAGRIELTYDADGRRVAASGAGVSRAWTWRDGALVGYRCADRETRIVRDADGRVVVEDTGGREARYRYDAAGQLVGASTGAGEWSFGYDAAGRVSREDGPGGPRGYTYDAAAQLVSVTSDAGTEELTYDGAGRRTGGYGWDAFGRLRSVGATRLTPDALGELAAVDDVALSWDPSGGPVAAGDSALVGPGTPWLVAGPGGSRALAADRQGSVGGGSGDPWGGAGPGVGLGYRGEVGVAGLVWLRARAYDPVTRAFLSPDPVEAVAGTAFAGNPYHYAGNDPVNAVDPWGLRPMTDEDAGGGGWMSDAGHGALDVLGLVPGFGEVADGVNAAWYAAEGDWVNAGLSAAAMVPFVGWAATGGKWGVRGAKFVTTPQGARTWVTGKPPGVPRNAVEVPFKDSKGKFPDGGRAFEWQGKPKAPNSAEDSVKWKYHAHGSNPKAPEGSNSALGPTYRIKSGSYHLDQYGNWHPHSAVKMDGDLASPSNTTHIPYPRSLPPPGVTTRRFIAPNPVALTGPEDE